MSHLEELKSLCKFCSNETPKKGMKYCSRKCTDAAKSQMNNIDCNCLECGKIFRVQKSKARTLCSEECRKIWQTKPENIKNRLDQIKKSVKSKYGVENIFQLEETKNKLKQTKMEKYGDENYNNGEKSTATKKEKYGEDYYKNMLEEQRKQTYLKKYGVTHHLKLEEFRAKQRKTNLEKYGSEYLINNPELKEKMKKTMMKKYGVENPSQSQEIKQKKKETSIKNFGVSHHLQDRKRFEAHLKGMYAVKKYKDTDITYQGSYELYFLEKIDEIGLITEITNGKSYKYIINDSEHLYHVDFFFRGSNIEIKSGWTYDKNGKDLVLREINDTKFQSVVEHGDRVIVLKSKSEIDGFIKALLN